MAINSNTPVLPTRTLDNFQAFIPVDIQKQDPNDPIKTTAKAQGVFIAGVLNTDGTISPLSANGGGGSLPTTPITGQQATTVGPVALAANALSNGLVVTALPANTATVYVGAAGVSAATGYPLLPGQSISFVIANSSNIYIIGTNTTDKIAFAGS